MTLIEELKVFALNILYCLYALTGFSLFFFSFGLRRVVFFGNAYFLPMPTENSFSVQAFNRMRHDLLPSGVQLVVTNPMSAFVSQILLSLFLGFMLTVPFFLYRILLYINPALFAHEKRMVVWSLLPSAFLFFSGSAFAYFFLVPATFRMLYPYAIVLGVVPFFSINEFIYYVFSLMAVTGIMFLLPLFMTLVSFLEIVPAGFWMDKWRHAFLFFMVLSAVITPDGTGVTMVLLFLPLTALYSAGSFFANRTGKRV